jgi:cob(I)alamin adenosyltransferase
MIYLYTGEGVGKTTSALGLVLRAVGQKKKVVIIQFMKGRKDIGEWKIRNKLAPYYQIYQFGRKEFIKPISKPKQADFELARRGLAFAKKILKKKPFLLILDEINLAINIGLISLENVLELLDNVPKGTNIVLTGRRASRKLIEKADMVNEMRVVKMPKRVKAEKGIQY